MAGILRRQPCNTPRLGNHGGEWMSDNLEQIDERLNDLWKKGRFEEAYEVISQDLVPILKDFLMSQGWSHADSKDIIGEALAGFSRRIHNEGPESIIAPKPFLWRAVEWRSNDLRKKSKRAALPESQIIPSDLVGTLSPHEYLDHQFFNGKGSHLIPAWQRRAIYVVEGLIEEAQVAAPEAVILVEGALARASEKTQEIIRYVLENGPDQPGVNAAAHFKITKGNYRVRKIRAYDEFRELILQVHRETGVSWRGVSQETVSAEEVVQVDFYPQDEGDNEPDPDEDAL